MKIAFVLYDQFTPLRTDSRMRYPQIDTEEAKLHQTTSGAGLR
jgi:hypothetical protein